MARGGAHTFGVGKCPRARIRSELRLSKIIPIPQAAAEGWPHLMKSLWAGVTPRRHFSHCSRDRLPARSSFHWRTGRAASSRYWREPWATSLSNLFDCVVMIVNVLTGSATSGVHLSH